MTYKDLPRVLLIERAIYPFPWSITIFRDCIRVGYHCYVAKEQNEIIGYGMMSIGAGECHLLNVCVQAQQQRRGAGRAIVDFLLSVAREQGVQLALLEVRVSNKAAYRLYQSFGFHEVGVRKNYYPAHQGREDALILAKEMGVSEILQAKSV